MGRIRLERGVNIQDNCTIHTDSKGSVVVGAYTLVGHNAILHGCQIGRACLIGIGSLVLDGARVGDGAMITAGCMIRGGMQIEAGSLVIQKGGELKVYPGKARYLQTLAGSLEYIALAKRWQQGHFGPFSDQELVRFQAEAIQLAAQLGLS
ncbi:MAG: gamma carbonic anhydrase family protein [Leptospiraceae bacterium]|nr:gamma carbonic anhydrase family protein [Leptospiraceae bacterium]